MSQLVPFNNGASTMQSAMQQVVIARAMNSTEDAESKAKYDSQALVMLNSMSIETIGRAAVNITNGIVGGAERVKNITTDQGQVDALLGVNTKLQQVLIEAAERSLKHL